MEADLACCRERFSFFILLGKGSVIVLVGPGRIGWQAACSGGPGFSLLAFYGLDVRRIAWAAASSHLEKGNSILGRNFGEVFPPRKRVLKTRCEKLPHICNF